MEEVTTCYTCEHCGASFKRKSFYTRHVNSGTCRKPAPDDFKYRLNGEEPPKRRECQYCGNTFSTERGFSKHRCEAMKRHKMLNTPDGRYAFRLYQQWFAMYRRSRPTADSFLKSRYFNAFIRLVNHIHRVELPCVGFFLRCMHQYDTDPTIWTRPEVYDAYLKLLDSRDMGDLLSDTISTMRDMMEEAEYTDPVEWFNSLNPRHLLHLADQRHISIRVLCFADAFHDYLAMHEDDRETVSLIMKKVPSHWLRGFMDDYPDLVEHVTTRINDWFKGDEI